MKYIKRICCSLIFSLTACLPLIYDRYFALEKWNILPTLLLIGVTLFLVIYPSILNHKVPDKRLKMCANGCELLIDFLISSVMSGIYLILLIPSMIPEQIWLWLGV